MTGRIVLFSVIGGLFFTISAMGSGHFGWWWLAGIVMAASFVPVVRFGPRNVYAHFGAMALALVVIGLWCTISEGIVFFPEKKAEMLQGLAGGTIAYVVIAALLAVLGRLLRLTDAAERTVEHRPIMAAIPLVLVAGVAYLVYYWVFGAITFMSYTKQFYPHAAEQAAAMGVWFPLYQVGRGLLMTLAVLPLIYTLRMKRWHAAVVVGILAWTVGGAGPLLVPTPLMGTAQRFAHILEIMTQNVSLGMTAVWLLRRKTVETAKALPKPTMV